MKTLIVLGLVLALATTAMCGVDSLQVTTTPTTQAKLGQVIVTSVTMKNVLTPREPITITAEARWEDELGNVMTTSASAVMNITQPIKVNAYVVTIPNLFVFVDGSAKVDGQSVTPMYAGEQLTFEVGRTLLEGQSVKLEYSIKTM